MPILYGWIHVRYHRAAAIASAHGTCVIEIENHTTASPRTDVRTPVNRRDDKHVDRRALTFKSFLCSLYMGRRGNDRRGRQQTPSYYVDLHEPWVLIVVAATLLLSVLDVYNTLILLAAGGTEMNPIMDMLIKRSVWAFFLLKYAMTAFGLLVLVAHRHFSIFRIIRADYVLIAVLLGYVVLIIYEFWLLAKIA